MNYDEFIWTSHATQQAEIRGISEELAKEVFECGSYYCCENGNHKIKYNIELSNTNKMITFIISKTDKVIITCYVDVRSKNKLKDNPISSKKYTKRFLSQKREQYKKERGEEDFKHYKRGTVYDYVD